MSISFLNLVKIFSPTIETKSLEILTLCKIWTKIIPMLQNFCAMLYIYFSKNLSFIVFHLLFCWGHTTVYEFSVSMCPVICKKTLWILHHCDCNDRDSMLKYIAYYWCKFWLPIHYLHRFRCLPPLKTSTHHESFNKGFDMDDC